MSSESDMKLHKLLLVLLLTLTLIHTTTSTTTAATLDLVSPNSLTLDQQEIIELHINTQEPITGVDAIINFDPQAVTINKVVKTSEVSFDHFHQQIDHENGTITIRASASTVKPNPSAGTQLANIYVTGTNPTITNFSISCSKDSTSDSNLLAADTITDIIECESLKETRLQVRSATSTSVDSLTITGKFAAVSSDVGPISAIIKLGTSVDPKPLATFTADFSFFQDDLYSTSITPELDQLALRPDYWITIKGEKHLARAVDLLDLTKPDTYLDLSNKPFLPGDLPPQNGQINNHDLNLILSHYTQPNPQPDPNLDLNFDGTINSLDFNLIINTLAQ